MLKEAVERLVKATQSNLNLVNMNRIASDRPPAQGYEKLWSETMYELEDIQIMLEKGD